MIVAELARNVHARARTEPEASSAEINSGHLRSYIERIERVESEIANHNIDKREIYKEARANGFEAKIIKKIVARRRIDPDKRAEEETLIDLYLAALGEGE